MRFCYRPQRSYLLLAALILVLLILSGCGPATETLDAIDYTPLPGEDWQVSTPAGQGVNPRLVAELYYNAARLESLYGLLVIKNGQLIAEGYFNGGSPEQARFMASATKSVTSALVGIALDQGWLSSVDQKMIDFFPEFTDRLPDLRKEQITIRDLLQMRSGYVWEERTAPYMESLFLPEGTGYHSLKNFLLPAIRELSLVTVI